MLFPFNLLRDPHRPGRPLYWLAIGAAMAIGAVIRDGWDGPLWGTMLFLLLVGLVGGLLIDRLFPGLRADDPALGSTRYRPRELAGSGGRWAVLDTTTDDYIEDGPQDNLYTWTGTVSEAILYAAALNRQEAPHEPA